MREAHASIIECIDHYGCKVTIRLSLRGVLLSKSDQDTGLRQGLTCVESYLMVIIFWVYPYFPHQSGAFMATCLPDCLLLLLLVLPSRMIMAIMQFAILGDVTTCGRFLDMTHVGRLDVELVAQANLEVMLVPDNQVQRFKETEAQRSGGRPVSYYGLSSMWEVIRCESVVGA